MPTTSTQRHQIGSKLKNTINQNSIVSMKGLIKFMPALALVAFASCSSDDFFGNSQTIAENELQVTVEQFDNVTANANTRAVREWKGATLNFQTDDAIRVYDNDLFKYDIYSFANGKFTRKNATSNISSIKWAAFPKDDVQRGYWDEDNTIKLEMRIPEYINYDGDREALVGDKIAYDSNLPMWGTAAADGAGASASLYHLTGVLAIKVKNMLQNVEYLILQSATQPIAGTFVATLNAEDPTSVYLKEGNKGDLQTFNQIVIDLRNVPSQTSVIYVPILDGVSDLQVFADKTFDDIASIWGADKVADYTSTYTFQRNKFKTLEASLGIGATTPAKLTALLEAYKNTLEDDLNIPLEEFYVGTTGGATDANYDGSARIGMPESDKEVTISFKAGMTYGNADNAAGTNQPLLIEDADPAKPFTGKLIFNVGNLLGTPTDITINLPKADVVLVGDFATNCASRDINFYAAKSLTIGDGVTATAIESDGTDDFEFSNGVNAGVTELTIAGNATLTSANKVVFDQFTKKINVNGNLVGGIDFDDSYSLFELNIGGWYNAATTTWNAAKITGDVWSIGNVNVALPVEGEAITGTLYMAGAEKTLALTQGYINKIENSVMVFGSWQSPYNTIKLDNTNQGRAAFLTLVDDADGAQIHGLLTNVASTTKFSETSVWDGNKITNATYKAFTSYTDNTGANVPSAIFTASQLASVNVAAASKLMININLNNNVWKGNNISANLDGNNKTISNLKLIRNQTAGAAAVDGRVNGLFNKAVTSALTVKNLTISGVTNELVDNSTTLGAFVGQNDVKVTAQNVAITGIDIAGSATKKLEYVGGFVGKAAADLDMQKVTVAGSIDGYQALGGFVGASTAASTLTFDKDCASTVTFNQTYNSGLTMDVLYGKIGGFIGTFDVAGATLDIKASAAPAALNHDKVTLEYVSDTSKENGDFYNYVPGQTYIGYCGATQLGNSKLPTINMKNAAGTAVNSNYVESYFYNGAKKIGNVDYAKNGAGAQIEFAVYTFTKKN